MAWPPWLGDLGHHSVGSVFAAGVIDDYGGAFAGQGERNAGSNAHDAPLVSLLIC